jgi:hypothetical protein
MEMPRYSGLLRLLAQISAVIGCITGAITLFGGLAAFRYGVGMGFAAVSGGLYIILASLAGLAVVYCFLALVEAQIDTRNAVIEYINSVRGRK